MKIVPQTLTGREFSWHAVLLLSREQQECATHNCEIHEDKKVLLYKTMHRMSMTRHNQQQLTQISLLPKTTAKCQTWGIAQTTASTQPYRTDAYEYLFLLSVLELKKLGHVTCLLLERVSSGKKWTQQVKSLRCSKRDKLSEKKIIQENPWQPQGITLLAGETLSSMCLVSDSITWSDKDFFFSVFKTKFLRSWKQSCRHFSEGGSKRFINTLSVKVLFLPR